jgi:hypothetical protein
VFNSSAQETLMKDNFEFLPSNEPSQYQTVSYLSPAIVSAPELLESYREGKITASGLLESANKSDFRWSEYAILGTEVMLERMLRELDTSPHNAKLVTNLAAELFGTHSSVYHSLLRMVSVNKKARSYYSSNKEQALKLLESSLIEPRGQLLVRRYISKLVHRRVGVLIAEDRIVTALRRLARFEPRLRNQDTVVLAAKAIALLAETAELEEQVVDLREASLYELVAYVENNTEKVELENFKKSLLEANSVLAVRSAQVGMAELAEYYFQNIIERRLDPNPQNDLLRFAIAEHATGSATKVARRRIKELESTAGLGFAQKIRLTVVGYYGWVIPFALLSLLFLLVAPLLYLYTPAVQLRDKAIKRGEPANDCDELTALLSHFGLSNGATEDDIFSAYQSACAENRFGSSSDVSENQMNDLVFKRIQEIHRGSFRPWDQVATDC